MKPEKSFGTLLKEGRRVYLITGAISAAVAACDALFIKSVGLKVIGMMIAFPALFFAVVISAVLWVIGKKM